jgi:hypothetical protein
MIVFVIAGCNMENDHNAVSQLCGEAKLASAMDRLLDRYEENPQDKDIRSAIIGRLKLLVQRDLVRKRWATATERLDAMAEVFAGEDLESLRELQSQFDQALANEMKDLESIMITSLSGQERQAALSRFGAIPEDLVTSHKETFDKLKVRQLEMLVEDFESEAKALEPEDLVRVQQQLEILGILRSEVFGLGDKAKVLQLKERLTKVEKDLKEFLMAPRLRTLRKYNLRALQALRVANNEYNSNTTFYNDDEEKLQQMLVRQLGPIDPKLLDAPTLVIYNEILNKTMEQLNIDQKLAVIEEIAGVEKMKLEE